MLVSATEKKPEPSSSVASAANSQPRGIASTTLALEDQLEDHLAADVGQQQRGESREGPVHRRAPAPSAEVVPGEQAREDEPRQDPEHRLVRDGERSEEHTSELQSQ